MEMRAGIRRFTHKFFGSIENVFSPELFHKTSLHLDYLEIRTIVPESADAFRVAETGG
jgi:hypothetical protein